MSISLRTYGYAANSSVAQRQSALNKAIIDCNFDAVLERLLYVADLQKPMNKHMNADIEWLRTKAPAPVIKVAVKSASKELLEKTENLKNISDRAEIIQMLAEINKAISNLSGIAADLIAKL